MQMMCKDLEEIKRVRFLFILGNESKFKKMMFYFYMSQLYNTIQYNRIHYQTIDRSVTFKRFEWLGGVEE